MDPLRHSPLMRRLADAGGRREEEEGWGLYTAFVGRRREVEAARQRMVLADESGNGCIEVQGVEVGSMLQATFGIEDVEVGDSFAAAGKRFMRLEEGKYLVSTLRGGQRAVLQALDAVGGLGGCRDLTPGVVQIRLIGPLVPQVLGRFCQRDLHPRAFGDGRVQAARLLGSSLIVGRRDIGALPSYVLIAPRPLGLSLWDGLLDRGRPFGAMPIGLEALKELKIVSQLYQEKRQRLATGRKASNA